LLGRERGVERFRPVRTVKRAIAILLFPDRLTGDVVEPNQLCLWQCRVLDFLTDQMSGTRLAMQSLSHRNIGKMSGWDSVRKTCFPLNSSHYNWVHDPLSLDSYRRRPARTIVGEEPVWVGDFQHVGKFDASVTTGEAMKVTRKFLSADTLKI